MSHKDTFHREMACFLVPGNKVLSLTSNGFLGAVDFDFPEIWKQLKDIKCDHVCMIHSHPPGCNRMSLTDENMVYGWVQGLGKPVFYIIVTEDGFVTYLCQRNKDNINKVDREIVKVDVSAAVDLMISVVLSLSYKPDKKRSSYPSTVEWLNDYLLSSLGITVVGG